MDDILAKHLTSTLLLLKNEDKIKTSDNETIIPFYSYKIIDKKFHIKSDGNTIISENVGYWKDKPIILHNNKKYVLLESSSNIVRIDNLGIQEDSITDYVIDTKNVEDKISNNLLKSIRDIITTSKPLVKQKDNPLIKKQKIVKKSQVVVKQEIPSKEEEKDIPDLSKIEDILEPLDPIIPQEFEQNTKPEIPSQEEIVKNVDEIAPKETDDKHSVISAYVDTLKKADQQTKQEEKPKEDTSEYIKIDKPKTLEDELFALLDTKKDDPRIKRFFNHFSEQTKKEVHEINEKYSKQYLAKLLENSGGGGTSNSSIDYSKGGIIDGDLSITSSLSVVGNIYGNFALDNKRVFYIGNYVDTDYVLDHNLNSKDLVVTLYDENDEMVLTSVKNINLNQTLISFDSPIQNIKVVIIR